ncbi:MAG TPA: lyase family protein [Thermoanaerobaculaceae bacterium]|nr:lyase family protein [Thermoanaerobaculaceae bacterium]HRS16249.1 lyase family protein [Thermoanaerobaculaceae bacterium]
MGVAAIRVLRGLEEEAVALREAFQGKEGAFVPIVGVGRTRHQDAKLTTLGREMGTYAETLARDGWRIDTSKERRRVVDLGSTAIGTGLGAPRQFVVRAADELRAICGLGLARAENPQETPANADVVVELSGMRKALTPTPLPGRAKAVIPEAVCRPRSPGRLVPR